jgi:CBS domain-containing protein
MTINRLLKGIDREIMSVLPNTPVQIAINILARDDTSALVVSIDDHLVLGILSSSDIVKYLDANGDLPIALMVSDIMTHDVISCEASEKVERLEQLMTEHQVRHVPVTNQGMLCAMVSVLDVVQFRMAAAEREAGLLRNYVSGVA